MDRRLSEANLTNNREQRAQQLFPPAMSVQGHSPLSSCNSYHISPPGNAAVFSDVGVPGKIGIGPKVSQNCEYFFFFAKYVYFYFYKPPRSQEDFFFFSFLLFLTEL